MASEMPLDEEFLRAARAARTRVAELLQAERLPESFSMKIVFAKNQYSESVQEETRFVLFLSKHAESVFDAGDELERCIDAHLAGGLPHWTRKEGQSPSEFEESKRMHLDMWFRKLIGLAMDSKGAADLTDEEFLNAYRAFRESLDADKTSYQVVVPLLNLKLSTNVKVAGFTLSLQPLADDAKSAIWNGSGMVESVFDKWDFLAATGCLAGSFSIPRGTRYDETNIRKEIETWITALRLLKSGKMGAIGLFTEKRPGHLGRTADMGWAVLDHRLGATNHSDELELNGSDADLLATLLARLNGLARRGYKDSLDVALRWFNGSYVRKTIEDRIIDFAVSLESTLLADVHEELKHRLALRGATLLADIRDTKEVHGMLRALYDVRSKIVHEGKSLGHKDVVKQIGKAYSGTYQGFVAACEQLVREVLHAYVLKLTPGQSVKTVNKGFDERVLVKLAEKESTSG